MLEVKNLQVSYGGVVAVKDISFSVERGMIVVLLGSNGAGKSSTLNAIAGLEASAGSVLFEGVQIGRLEAEEIVHRGVALTPEGRRIFPSLSVSDNLHLGGAAHVRGEELSQRIEEQLDRFPILRERFYQKAGLLSGGEQQMLAIGRSLMSAPRLLLLDEPSLGLAPLIVDKVFELILALRDRGLTILLVEQNSERALEIADYGYVLQSGSIVLEGSGRELASTELVKQAYLAE